MAKTIKGINIVLGAETTGLQKALGDVNKESKDIQSELGKVNRLLKFNPEDTTLLAQKQKLLGDQVAVTREKLDRLKAAQEQVNEQFERGDITEGQYRAFQREIVETESKLKHYEGQLKQLSGTKKDFADRLKDVGEKLQNVGDRVGKVGRELSTKLTTTITAAGAGMLALATKAGQAADRLLDLSDITGMTTDSIQQWQYVANQAGVSTEAMTSAVEGLVRKIPQLESEGGKVTEQLNKLGLSYEYLKGLSPDEQVDALMYSLAAMEDPLERNAAGSQLFGGAWRDIAPMLGMGQEGIENVRREAETLGLVLDRDALEGANEFRQEMDRMKAVLGATAMQIGSELAPVIRDQLAPIIQNTVIPAMQSLSENAKRLIDWFAELEPKTQGLIMAITGIAAAIGPVLMVLAPFITMLGKLIGLAASLKPLLIAVGAAIGGITLPVAATIAAITALIAVGVALWKNWDKVKEFAANLWKNVTQSFENMKNAVSEKMSAVWQSIKDRWDAIMDFFKGINLIDIGKDIIQGLINGIQDKFNALKEKMRDIGDSIKDTIANVLGIRSPSRVMIGFGENIGEGMAIGIERASSMVQEMSQRMANMAVPDVSGLSAQAVNNSTTNNQVSNVFYVTVQADDLRQVGDVIDMFNNLRQTARQGV